MRNPDEFYFGMIKSKTKKGVHVVQRNEHYSHELLQLLKTQDQNYIHYQKGINSKVSLIELEFERNLICWDVETRETATRTSFVCHE